MSTDSRAAAIKAIEDFTKKAEAYVKSTAGKSTGPKTPEGKAAAARNAFRHGLTSAIAVIPGEDAAAFDKLLFDMRLDHRPRTSIEDQCVELMANAYWKTLRITKIEKAIWDVELEAATPETSPVHKMAASFLKGSNVSSALDKLNRYQAEARRAYHQAENTLRRHQVYAIQSLETDRRRAVDQDGDLGLFKVDSIAYLRAEELRLNAGIGGNMDEILAPETNVQAAAGPEKAVA